jgi:hypothetical protein
VAPEEEKHLAEIEKLLKKKIVLCAAEGFDATAALAGARERAPRATSGARGERAPRSANGSGEHRASRREHAENGPSRARPARAAVKRDTGDETPAPFTSNGDARRAEREAAYARNPDQPLVHREGTPTHPHAHMHAARKTRPVPVLLQKRRTPEPEKV